MMKPLNPETPNSPDATDAEIFELLSSPTREQRYKGLELWIKANVSSRHTVSELIKNDFARFRSGLESIHSDAEKIWEEIAGVSMEQLANMPAQNWEVDWILGFSTHVLVLDENVIKKYTDTYKNVIYDKFSLEASGDTTGDFCFGFLDTFRKGTYRIAVYFLPSSCLDQLLSNEVGKKIYQLLTQALDWSHHDFTAHAMFMFQQSSNELNAIFGENSPEAQIDRILEDSRLSRGSKSESRLEEYSLKLHIDFIKNLLKKRPTLLRLLTIKNESFKRLLKETPLSDQQKSLIKYVWYFSINRLLDTIESITAMTPPENKERLSNLYADTKKALDKTSEGPFINQVRRPPNPTVTNKPFDHTDAPKLIQRYFSVQETLYTLSPLREIIIEPTLPQKLSPEQIEKIKKQSPKHTARYIAHIASNWGMTPDPFEATAIRIELNIDRVYKLLEQGLPLTPVLTPP